MTAFTTQAGVLKTVSLAVTLATLLVTGAAQAADSNDRIIPPNPADVAMLRSLLALQHPALRQGVVPATAGAPTVVTEPSQQSGQQS